LKALSIFCEVLNQLYEIHILGLHWSLLMSKKQRKSRRKPATELTKEQAMRRLFPKEIRDEAKRLAHEKDLKE